MKKLVLILATIALTSVIGYSQDIPEKANTIVLTQTDSIGLAEKAIKVLADKGHVVNSKKGAMPITTAAFTLKNGTRVSYVVMIKGTEIILSGRLPVAGQPTHNIAYQGKKGTPMMNGWEEMTKIAKEIGGKVSYQTK